MSLFDIKNKHVRHQFLQNYKKDMDKIVENRQHLQKSEIKKTRNNKRIYRSNCFSNLTNK